MHLKAIAIKERLLGAEDYEVALSVGHLASLYNYDMQKHEEAEKLYLRSISIGEEFCDTKCEYLNICVIGKYVPDNYLCSYYLVFANGWYLFY